MSSLSTMIILENIKMRLIKKIIKKLQKSVDINKNRWYYIQAFDGNGPVAQVVRAHP